MSDKRVFIVAGGTGGHLYPGIALARELRQASCPVTFIVRRGDLGKAALEREGFPIQELTGQGFPRRFSWQGFLFPFKLAAGFWQAFFLLLRKRPEIVVGMGGYLSFPVLLAARICAVKTLIHEQNVIPGVANRLLGFFVDSIAVSFSESRSHFFGDKTWVSGLPVRADIGTVDREEARRRLGLDEKTKTFLVFGGSQGAHRLNAVLPESFHLVAETNPAFQVLHVTGDKDHAGVQEVYRRLPIRSVVLPYCHEMPEAYGAADLVICRSGASTVAELLLACRPAILIPFPFATAAHQLHNAELLERQGHSKIWLEKDLDAKRLAERLLRFLREPVTCARPRAQTPAARELAGYIQGKLL